MQARNQSRPQMARALYYTAPGKVELRLSPVNSINTENASEHAVVKTLWSAISRGTERLVFQGRIPASEFARMRAPYQEGEFPFPVKYGYSAVGCVEDGAPNLLGKTVFCLHPHQTTFAVPVKAIVPLPEGVPPRRAILAANMETALNGIWDSGATAGDRIAIVGAGAVGLLIASILGRIPGTEILVCDTDPARESIARSLGAEFVAPNALCNAEADIVFHASATQAGLETSLAAAGFEARVVELSWYGDKRIEAPFGANFHSKRLQLISSQVGAVSPARRSRWTYGRRLAKSVELLNDPRLEQLITQEVDFDDLPQAVTTIFEPHSRGIVTAIRYSS